MKQSDYLKSLDDLLFFQSADRKWSFEYYVAWYSKRHPIYRIAFYLLCSVTLLSVIALYFFLKAPGIRELLATGSVFITGLTSLFPVKRSWSGCFLAEINLRALKDKYDESLIRAKLIAVEDETKALEITVTSTQQFMDGAIKVINIETTGYFASIKAPKLNFGKLA
ncbi:MAG: hypothetical protein ACJAS1_004306 [Oleiphilaceae bacterium]|jgi:hypothetical protein